MNLELTPLDGGAVVSARTDHLGIGFFENLPGGAYQVRLQREQAEALGLALVGAPTVILPTKGGYVDGGQILVRFQRDLAS